MNIVILAGVLITLATGIPVAFQLLRQHPRGLFVLFFAEMWERFSYYGMRGLLVFYLTQHFLFEQKTASLQYGSYATMVYLMPLVGGILADRYLGARKAVAFGAVLLVLGQGLMAVQGAPARQSLTYAGVSYALDVKGRGDDRQVQLTVAGRDYAFDKAADGAFEVKGLPPASPLPSRLPAGSYRLVTAPVAPLFTNGLYLALALIIMGVGFLKPNISSVVGQLYGEGDPRRDPGFTLYYFGVNLGAFWAAILCGYLGQTYGWSWGFGLAGAGMAAGWLSFLLGRRWLEGRGEPPDPIALRQPVLGPLSREHLIYLGALVALAPVFLLVQFNAVVGVILGVSSLAVLAYVGLQMARAGKVERERLFLALTLIAGSIVFFTLFEQAATSLNLFAEQNTQLGLIAHPATWRLGATTLFFGDQAMWSAAHEPAGTIWIDMGFTAAQVQSFNAGFILLLAPVFAAVWSALGRSGRDPNPMIKFGLGLAQVGLGFLLIVACGGTANADYRVPLLVLAGAYFLHTTGELCLSPVGMSQITKLSPLALVSTMMAIWFLATSWAQFIGALIAQLAGTETAGGKVLDPGAALHAALGVFAAIGWTGVGFGVLFLVLSPVLKRWAHGADEVKPLTHEPIAPDVDGGLQEVNPAMLRAER